MNFNELKYRSSNIYLFGVTVMVDVVVEGFGVEVVVCSGQRISPFLLAG